MGPKFTTVGGLTDPGRRAQAAIRSGKVDVVAPSSTDVVPLLAHSMLRSGRNPIYGQSNPVAGAMGR